MIRGRVNIHEEPVVSVTLLAGRRKIKKQAIVDTGFNGYLSVPLSLVRGSWYFFGHEKYEIATGEVVEQKVYLGKIEWNGRVQDVYAVTSHAADILIGTKLLRRNKLVIDFPKRAVFLR